MQTKRILLIEESEVLRETLALILGRSLSSKKDLCRRSDFRFFRPAGALPELTEFKNLVRSEAQEKGELETAESLTQIRNGLYNETRTEIDHAQREDSSATVAI